ncbi:hypothetical protein ACA910_017531 [Epithemia clementina (nom. ined.)]
MPQQQQQQQQTRGKEPAGRRYGYNRSYHGHLQQDSAAKMALHSRRYQSKAVLQIEQPSKPMTSNTATQGRNRLPGTGRPSKTPDFITQTDLYAPPPCLSNVIRCGLKIHQVPNHTCLPATKMGSLVETLEEQLQLEAS